MITVSAESMVDDLDKYDCRRELLRPTVWGAELSSRGKCALSAAMHDYRSKGRTPPPESTMEPDQPLRDERDDIAESF